MKVLLVNGSPNKDGCTNAALEEVARELAAQGIETEVFWLGRSAISGCIACRSCAKTGECFMDDGVNAFRAKAKEADGFIFGTPVHYAAASGSLTAFMDRLFFSDSGETFRLKPAAAVAVARRGGTTAALDQVNKYFAISGMLQVGSCYWNMVHGMTPQELQQDEEGLYTMRVLGRNMAYLLRCLAAGKAAGVPLPARETPKRTHFIH